MNDSESSPQLDHMSKQDDEKNENELESAVEPNNNATTTTTTEDQPDYTQLLEKKNEEIYNLTTKCAQLEGKLEALTKQKDLAHREKEAMVIKYAVGEKNLLDMRVLKEHSDKKHKEALSEIEILQHRVQVMCSEKARICQMLDNKCYEYKTSQQELEQTKADLSALETKLKWSQNSLKTEIQLHKDSQAKIDLLNGKLQEYLDQSEQARRDAQDTIKAFHTSQENKAHVLEQQLKEQQATLILLRHEKEDREQQLTSLHTQLEKLQTKQQHMLQENNNLSLRVQQLERDRLDSEQKLSELRACADQQRQDSADLQSKTSLLDQLRLQLKNEQDHRQVCDEQIQLLRQRNSELESDMVVCRDREAELLLFTQQLTDKNVRLQSEFTSLETRVQQLTCEQTILRRCVKEQETRGGLAVAQLAEERTRYQEEIQDLQRALYDKTTLADRLRQQVLDHEEEIKLLKRKYDLSLKEINKELQQCRKRLEQQQQQQQSNSSSNSSLNEQVKVIQPQDAGLDRQTLIEHVIKLQRISVRKSEKLDFLEEHVNTLVLELQKKSRLLQSYILRDQAGTLTSNSMDNNKANIARLNGIMASVYSSRVADDSLTLELSLDINRKLQAILEDALLKNITLKESVDTLGREIERLLNHQSTPNNNAK